MTGKDYKFKFSIVSAVYNVEKYIDEMVESIINQDIGFKENVQLILVDDCSKDNSFEICKKYEKQYPNNIIVLQTKTNSRQAVARNLGIRKAVGKYINFVDSDDKLSLNTLSSVFKFFEDNYKNVDVVSIPMMFFGGLKGPHHLNGKFNKGTRIIDLINEPNTIQLSAATAFIKNEVVKKYVKFDKKLYHAEDAKEMIKVLDLKRKLGVVSNVTYWYRKHAASTISNIPTTKESYIDYMKYFQEEVADMFVRKYKKIPKFAQYALMYDLQGKLKVNKIPEGVLTDEEKKVYIEKVLNCSSKIDDDIILKQTVISREIKVFLIFNKYKSKLKEKEYIQFIKKKHLAGKLISLPVIDFIEIENNRITIRFHLNLSPDYENYVIYTNLNGKKTAVKIDKIEKNCIIDDINIYNSVYGTFSFDFTKSKLNKLFFIIKCFNKERKIQNIVFTKNTPLNKELPQSYYIFDKYKIKYLNGDIIVKRTKLFDQIGSEIKLTFSILKQKTWLKKHKIILARWIYVLFKPFMKNKKIWLFADKADKADDNAEALFKYVNKHKGKRKIYFLINKNFPDYKRLKKYGKVVNYLSLKHYFLYMFADFKISAYSHKDFVNPFRVYEGFFRDISYNSKFVFLQHGIIFGDLSHILKRSMINATYFVTSTKSEYENVLENYGYNNNQVILTGLPRYDYLYNNEKKVITIAPTWRQGLFAGMDELTSRRILKPNFEDSLYYKRICGLLNSKKLLKAANKYGYQIQYLPHSIFFPYADRFKIDKEVKVLSYQNISYREMFAESSLIVTDYSSLVFDFAYLKKPVLYYQFDKFNGGYNYNDGYFDFEKHGFGEVVYDDENKIVDLICNYMKNNCALKTKYEKRIDKTFMYKDKNNCERIFNKIIELEKNKKR